MNYDHKAFRELITGMSGSGKSTLWLDTVKNHRSPRGNRRVKWKFIFDPERECARKLGWRTVIDVPGMIREMAAGRPVCFDGSLLFPGNRRGAFAFFARWVFNVSRKFDGTKLFSCDELQSVQTTGPSGMPPALKEIIDEGRRQEIDCLFAGQRLNEINDDVRGQLTAITTLKQDDPLSLRWLVERGFDETDVRNLPYPAIDGCAGWIRRSHTGEITTKNLRRAKAHAARARAGGNAFARR